VNYSNERLSTVKILFVDGAHEFVVVEVCVVKDVPEHYSRITNRAEALNVT